MNDEPVFLITGASTGIGAATAKRAKEAGYRLVLVARSKEKLESLAAELGGPDHAIAVAGDVGEWEDNEVMVKAALDTFGRLDIVFANAGFGAKRGWLTESPEHWRSMVLTNVLGAAYTVRASIPALKETKGQVLLTGSVVGRRVMTGSLYSCTKWAVTAMADAVRMDLRGTGIRTSLIEPGATDTPFFDDPAEGRLDADDIARAVMYAISQPPHVDVASVMVRPVGG